jgi:glucose-1-phosphate cytidylyltransferase
VNGGFFVMEPRALEAIGPDDILEREPLEVLAANNDLTAYRHDGFWDCMDTYKDTLLLNELWTLDRAPWRPLVEAGR